MTEEAVTLPPLPERIAVLPRLVLPEDHGMGGNTTVFKTVDAYTADQMREYARAAILGERERCARVCEAEARRIADEEDASDNPHNTPTTGYFGPMECAAAIRKGE